MLVKLNVLAANVTALQICQGGSASAAGAADKKELVMPTLATVGINLTRQAADKLLNPVLGATRRFDRAFAL